MRRLVCFVVLLAFITILPASSFAEKNNLVTITVAASAQARLETKISVDESPKLAKRILACKTVQDAHGPQLPRATVTIGSRVFVYDAMSRLLEMKQPYRKVLLTTSLQQELEGWVANAEGLHYGQLSDWNQVKTEFRRLSYAKVIDLETGESFRVQRRAGTRHADVQPLTKNDSKTMKGIYEGKWSWKRRAILVEINGKFYAASMHGMPHGAGAIRGNAFPGHFCIHFQGSSTHRRKVEDPSHQFMIIKASGRLAESIMQAEPKQLVSYFLTAIREEDFHSMAMTMGKISLPFQDDELESFSWSIEENTKLDTDLLAAEMQAKVRYQLKGKKAINRKWAIVVTRASLLDRWIISDLHEVKK